MAKLSSILISVAEGLSHLAGGVALQPNENKSLEDIVNNIMDNAHKALVPDVKISKADIDKAVKPLVTDALKSLDARLKVLEEKAK